MTNLECIEYASKHSFKGLYEKGLREGATKILEKVFSCHYVYGDDCSKCGAKDECIVIDCKLLLENEEAKSETTN